jgi:NADH-quinone oxidoreductase subunit A
MEAISPVGLMSPWEPSVFALTVYGVLILAVIASQLFLASWLGERRPSLEKSRPYECGVIPTGSARFRYPVLIFDVEGAYIFSWAVTYRDLGWTGWLQMSFFILVLLIGLLYIWKRGGLDWRPAHKAK